MIAQILIIVFVICYLIYHVSKREFDYWKKWNIPYSKPLPFVGNYGEYICLRKFMGLVAQEICQKYPKAPYVGAFFGCKPTLMVQDPDVIKLIMAKDFYYFNSREIADYAHKELITRNLFFSYGDRWKLLRQNLTPLFSSAKIKNMFYLIEKCAHEFENLLDYECQQNNVIKVRALMSRFTMDCIGECIFGVETRTMERNSENNPFTIMGELIFKDTNYRGFKQIARSAWPSVFYGIGLKNFPDDIVSFFHKLMTDVFAGRQYKPTSRNDFVDLILNLKQKNYITGDGIKNSKGDQTKISQKVDDDFLVSQCIGIFAAGYETSATTLHYTLYEFAKNEEIQNRAIQEIDEYLKRNNNKIGYGCTTELPFLEACIDETLRLYPVLSVITREVVEKYTLPCGAVLDKGVRVHIPVYHMHHNPEYFENPEEYKPDRFLGDAKRDIRQYAYLPFGEGPRICIGMRFSRMQIIPGIITVLKKYSVRLTEDTPLKLEFGANTLVTQPIQEIKLRFIEREGWVDRLLVYGEDNITN
ncbi:cytochrome P450 6B2-like [Achroia grisella]|uniref:cytochrome P450 6B2-like n=1 Tax=Achroia grisella TaxID=688607 RepID=UPI0027D271C6|nr:cytochrome P450 6B2-like [Achroia grisella]